MNIKFNRYFLGYLFILPSAALLIFWFYVPVVWTFILSFQNWNGFLRRSWVYFDNYTRGFHDPNYLSSIWKSVYLAVGTTAGALLLGLLMALLVYSVGKKEGSVYRLIFAMPLMVPTAIIGVLFTFAFNPVVGIINNFLRLIGLGNWSQAWLENFHTVMPSLISVGVWRLAGLNMILIFAGLTLIPKSMLEAAKIEGAGFIKQIFMVLLPLTRPIIALAALYTLTLGFKTFDIVYTLTRGGPADLTKTVPLYMTETAFTYSEFGYASSLGIIMTLVTVLVIVIFNRLLKGDHYEF